MYIKRWSLIFPCISRIVRMYLHSTCLVTLTICCPIFGSNMQYIQMLTSHSQKCLPVLERTALNHSGEFFVTKLHISEIYQKTSDAFMQMLPLCTSLLFGHGRSCNWIVICVVICVLTKISAWTMSDMVKCRAAIWSFLKLTALYFTMSDIVHRYIHLCSCYCMVLSSELNINGVGNLSFFLIWN